MEGESNLSLSWLLLLLILHIVLLLILYTKHFWQMRVDTWLIFLQIRELLFCVEEKTDCDINGFLVGWFLYHNPFYIVLIFSKYLRSCTLLPTSWWRHRVELFLPIYPQQASFDQKPLKENEGLTCYCICRYLGHYLSIRQSIAVCKQHSRLLGQSQVNFCLGFPDLFMSRKYVEFNVLNLI